MGVFMQNVSNIDSDLPAQSHCLWVDTPATFRVAGFRAVAVVEQAGLGLIYS